PPPPPRPRPPPKRRKRRRKRRRRKKRKSPKTRRQRGSVRSSAEPKAPVPSSRHAERQRESPQGPPFFAAACAFLLRSFAVYPVALSRNVLMALMVSVSTWSGA